jgi:hypothetical protein
MAELSITDGSLYLRPADIFSIAQERNNPNELFNSHRRLVIPSSGPCWTLYGWELVRMPFQRMQDRDSFQELEDTDAIPTELFDGLLHATIVSQISLLRSRAPNVTAVRLGAKGPACQVQNEEAS